MCFADAFNCMPDLEHASPDPLSDEEEKQLRDRMKSVTINLCFRTLPSVPQSGKWTKSGPAVDYFMPSLAATPLLRTVWDAAFAATVEKGQPAAQSEALALSGVEDSWLETVAWRAVGSKRVKKGGDFVKRETTPALMFIVGIVHEPLRWLTGYFLMVSSPARRRGQFASPELCTFACPKKSPITGVMQYLSELLAGAALRLDMLVHSSKSGNFQNWAAANPGLLSALRHGATIASSWIHRRFWVEGMCFPWRLSMCVDTRLPEAERKRVLKEFLDFPLLRLDPHFSQKLRRFISANIAVEEHEAILERCPLISRFLLRWAWVVRLSCAQVEFVHGRNRRRCAKDTSFATFLTDFMLDETKLRVEVRDAPATCDILQRADQPQKKKRVRKQSALDIYSGEYHNVQRQHQRSFNAIANPEHAAEVKAEFDKLPARRRRIYEQLAELSPSAGDQIVKIQYGGLGILW